MTGIGASIELYDKVSAPINKMLAAMANLVDGFESMGSAMDGGFDTSKIEAARRGIEGAALEVIQLGSEIEQNSSKQNKYNKKVKEGGVAADDLTKKVMGMVGAYASLQGVQKVLDLSDQYTQTTARLGMIVDEQNTVVGLQDKIMQSANRSRSSYADTADMVAKLSLRTGDLFSNDEAIVFAENLNKLYKVAGASQEEMKSSQLQLTQALGSGVLRGEEFNAVFEAAPNIMQTVADYMGVPIGSLRQMAQDGQITGDVVKNAILGATSDIDTAFGNMPATWGEVWTIIGNTAFEAFQPVIQMIAEGAAWVSENWSTIEPIFWGIAAAVGILAAAFLIWKVVTLVQTIAQWALNSALLASPITWIVLAIALVVGAIVIWINKIGGLKVAWLIVVNALLIAWDWVKIAFFTGVYWVIGLWDTLVLGMKTAGVAIANFMGDMKVSVLTILQNMINGAIDIINAFINTLNKIPGVSIDTISKVTFASTAAAQNEAEKQAREDDLEDFRSEIDAKAAERDASLQSMKDEAANEAAERQAEIDAAKAEAANEESADAMREEVANSAETFEGIEQNTGETADALSITNEDLKYLKDLAEQEAVNRFTTAEIKVDMTNNNTVNSGMDLDGVVDQLATGVNEAMEKAAEGVHE